MHRTSDSSIDERNQNPFARDLRLSREALAAHEGAQREFARRMRCVPRFLAAKNSRLGSPLSEHDIEDLTQEVLERLWRRLETYLGRSSLETWAYRCTHRELYRRLKARPVAVALHTGSLPDRADEAKEEHYDDVYRALESLAPGDRQVIELKHFDELTFEQIGTRLALSPNTAKTRYYRGLEQLRRLLESSRSDGASS